MAWLAAVSGAESEAPADIEPDGSQEAGAERTPVSAPIVLVVRRRRGPTGAELVIAAHREPGLPELTPEGDSAAAWSWRQEAPARGAVAEATGVSVTASLPAAAGRAGEASPLVTALPARAALPGPAALPAQARYPRRLVGFRRRRMFLFDPARVLAFELRGGLVHATFEDGDTYTTNYSIRELESRLPASDFFRIHRDVIVNLMRVKELERVGQGRLRLLLDTPDARGFLASRPASARLRKLLRL